MVIFLFMVRSKTEGDMTVQKICNLYTEVTTPYVKPDGTKGSKPIAKPGEPIFKDIENLRQAIGKYSTAEVLAGLFSESLESKDFSGEEKENVLKTYFGEDFSLELAETLVHRAFKDGKDERSS